jgi:hypothetical protein
MWSVQRTRECFLPRRTVATEQTGWHRAKLILLAVLWILLGGSGCRRDTEADRRMDKLSSLLSKGGNVVVKARLLSSDDLEQKETAFVDLSSKSEFILSLLLPARAVDNLSGPYPEICQIQVAEDKDAEPTLFHIYELGKGPALYSVESFSQRYGRVVRSVPQNRQDRLDESVSLCAFIKAAVEGDRVKQAEYEGALRLSACLDQPK